MVFTEKRFQVFSRFRYFVVQCVGSGEFQEYLRLIFLLSCNKDAEEIKPLPEVEGTWRHKYFFRDDLTITADSLFQYGDAWGMEQVSDTLMILDNGASQRNGHYVLLNNGELYFSFARSLNNNPLRIGQDDLVDEIYVRK